MTVAFRRRCSEEEHLALTERTRHVTGDRNTVLLDEAHLEPIIGDAHAVDAPVDIDIEIDVEPLAGHELFV